MSDSQNEAPQQTPPPPPKRKRRAPAKKNASTIITEEAQPAPDEQAHLPNTGQVESGATPKPEEAPQATENNTDSQSAPADPNEAQGEKSESARKGRRGRRGGRSRNKGKTPVEASDEAMDDALPEASDKAANDSASIADSETKAGQKPKKGRGSQKAGHGKRGRAEAPAPETQDETTPQEQNSDYDPELELDTDPDEADLWDDEPEADLDDDDGDEQSPARQSKSRHGKGPKSPAIKAKVQAMAGRRKMFISVMPGEQVEVVLSEEGTVHEYYLEMSNQAKFKGNIYKGIIHNIDANLQAAFVNYGASKNGFLQIDEVHPEYYLTTHEPAKGKKFPPIQKVLKSGQEVLVQVVKEPSGNKGAFLTTWLSLAGRFLVLTPGQEQIGISRKVDNDEERSRLREMMNGIDPGSGLGVIVRTVSAGTSKTTLKNDLMYLKRLWKDIRKRGTTETAPAMIHEEPGLAARAVRDYLTDDVHEIWMDNETAASSVRDMAGLLFPRKSNLVKVHSDERHSMWERFNLQRQLEQIYGREVNLPSGGRLVFDQTEALMAIDINSGKISGKGNFEAMAMKTNIEAAEAIPRHLKLRDIGGQIVIDFIELRDKNNIREVEKTLRNAMKNDRARNDVGRMSSFGLLEMVRQRTGSSALAITMEQCPCCKGTGLRRNMEWQSLQALRDIDFKARSTGAEFFTYEANSELGLYLLNHKRDRLREMEQRLCKKIEIKIVNK